MPENRQFRQRLAAWQAELKRQLITPVAPVPFSGCPVLRRLSAEEAACLPYRPMPVETRWGERREYAWFSAVCDVPEGCAGRRLVLLSGVDGEQLVWLDGRAVGAVDQRHGYVTLFQSAPSGGSFRLLIESYAGHGPRLESLGPCPPERTPIPPVTGPQCTVRESWLAVFDEDAYQLHIDVETLAGLMDLLPEGSLRRQRVEAALDGFTHIVDFELPPEGRRAAYLRAREALQEVLSCRNGSSAPVMHIFGQSHIDLAWLWPMEETFHKAARTYATQLSLMDEYPEYRFLACEPALLEMLREREPEIYARALEHIRAGQIQPEGAFYVECDTNIPSGESLIRQLLWGKRWFREELGVEAKVGWQPDTFGFAPCLPQLLRAFDIPYFATQKLLRADPECERFPYQDFLWEGPDGSRVQALSFFKNNARTDPASLKERWEKHRTQTTDISALLYPFGYGDGGGGADRDLLEYLRRETDLEGLPRTRWCALDEHFRMAEDSARKNIWHGELYLAWHRGTYTAQRKTKTAIRALEQALHDAEGLLALCGEETRRAEQPRLKAAWKTLLIHQFHDIAAGVGIRDVHEEAVRALAEAEAAVRDVTEGLARQVCGIKAAEGWFTALNTLPFERRERVTLPGGEKGWLTLPASGAISMSTADLEPDEGTVRVRKTDSGMQVDNGVLSFVIGDDGSISELTDLRSGLPLQSPGQRLNDLRLYRNVEPVYDAWELSRDYRRDRVDEIRVHGIHLEGENTPCLTVTVERTIGISRSVQRIRVMAGVSRIEFETEIDWRERHKLLKAHFEINLRSENAIHEMQFGHVERPAHRSTAYAKDRYEVCNRHYSALFEAGRGVALMNRAIWGVSCEEGDLALSLLRAPCVPDDTCDRGMQRLDYALYVYDTPFALSAVTHDGYAYNNQPLVFPGRGQGFSGFRAENAMIETVKPAEDGRGTVIRLWEYRGTRTMAELRLPHRSEICACSMDEREATPLTRDDRWHFELGPFEIKSFLIRPDRC
ncbi:MAG: alpha-mannosidase [Clostridia bacterium]|nr:alpha-mannosidase [Clostridia bacterium]